MSEVTSTTFTTTGMHCRSCSMLVDMTLGDLAGVADSETDYVTGRTQVTFDPDAVTIEDIYAAVRSAGYDVEVP